MTFPKKTEKCDSQSQMNILSKRQFKMAALDNWKSGSLKSVNNNFEENSCHQCQLWVFYRDIHVAGFMRKW